MTKEELLQLLQEKGLSDDEIKELLKGVLGALDNDFEEHDEKKEAERLLGVEL